MYQRECYRYIIYQLQGETLKKKLYLDFMGTPFFLFLW